MKMETVSRGSFDVTFMVFVLLLLTLGLVMLFSASYAYAYYQKGDSFHYIKRQLIFAVAGVVAMVIFSKIDYHIWQKFVMYIYGAALVLLVVVLFMEPINNARRWIILELPGLSFTFQPSEIAKFAIVILFSHIISVNYDKMKTFKFGLLPFGIALLPIIVLMVLEPHLSGTILILAIGATLMFIGGTNIKWFSAAAIAAVGVIAVVIFVPGLNAYASSRLEYWIDPWSDALGKGFQTIQSLLAIGSGGLMGVGLGNSRQKYLYIPEPQNDFVFSIVCEELGFIGAALIVIIFAMLVWRGFVIALRAKDKFGSMLAAGLTVQVGLQAALNIAVVTNTIPNTGISMPFFSYGGTALLMLLAQMGIVLSVSRSTTLEKE